MLAPVRKRRFFSFTELNTAIAERVAEVNDNGRFRDQTLSRRQLFEELERGALQPLPPTPHEFAVWKLAATVNIDYQVEFDARFYSLPHRLRREQVDVRATASTVEIFHPGRQVTSHAREYGRRRFLIQPEHMPASHGAHLECTPSRLTAAPGDSRHTDAEWSVPADHSGVRNTAGERPPVDRQPRQWARVQRIGVGHDRSAERPDRHLARDDVSAIAYLTGRGAPLNRQSIVCTVHEPIHSLALPVPFDWPGPMAVSGNADPLSMVRAARRTLAEIGPIRSRSEGDFERVALSARDADVLRDLLVGERARVVVEVGLAYGSSALAIGEALLTVGLPQANHVIIDAYQDRFLNVGWEVVESAGLAGLATLVRERSQLALPRLVEQEFVATPRSWMAATSSTMPSSICTSCARSFDRAA